MRETEADISPERRTCYNCGAYRYFIDIKHYKCIEGHVIDSADWRLKYSVCDKWRAKK